VNEINESSLVCAYCHKAIKVGEAKPVPVARPTGPPVTVYVHAHHPQRHQEP
jgi:hypothetical protein